MAAWSQILQIVGNSTLIYLSFDTHGSPGTVFIQEWEIFSPDLLVCYGSTILQQMAAQFENDEREPNGFGLSSLLALNFTSKSKYVTAASMASTC